MFSNYCSKYLSACLCLLFNLAIEPSASALNSDPEMQSFCGFASGDTPEISQNMDEYRRFVLTDENLNRKVLLLDVDPSFVDGQPLRVLRSAVLKNEIVCAQGVPIDEPVFDKMKVQFAHLKKEIPFSNSNKSLADKNLEKYNTSPVELIKSAAIFSPFKNF